MKIYLYKLLYLFLVPILMASSCQKDEEEIDPNAFMPIEFYKFSDFNGNDSSWKPKTEFNNNFHIINSEEELRKYIDADSMPEIDFTEFIVILGSRSFNSNVLVLSEIVEVNNTELAYNVVFVQNDSVNSTDAKYHIVIPMPYNKDIKVVELYKDSISQ